MKVTATTLPRKSAKVTRLPSCEIKVNSGAGPIVGQPLIVWSIMGKGDYCRPADASVRPSIWPSRSRLEFALELVKKAPVRAVWL